MKYSITLALLFFSFLCYGTHNRAGEITYKHIEGNTFEITVTTYTYQPSQANRPELLVNWGDGESEYVNINNGYPILLPNLYNWNTYTKRHTYPGPGIYTILVEDPNRNLGVANIPNSVNTIFSIRTTMIIGQFSGTNSTPLLLSRPIDNAAKGHIFIHNPAAFDPDGDSISYQLTECTGANGQPIDGYTLPPASDTLFISPEGNLTWWVPVDTGVYNIAMYVIEWRNGVRIGRIARDMQIDVYETDNNPPENPELNDYCIVAGDSVSFSLKSTDPDDDPLRYEMQGGPIKDGRAKFNIFSDNNNFDTLGVFKWVTTCKDARQQPYGFVFKTKDSVSDIPLVDISSFNIKVLHRAPENVLLIPGADTIRIQWDKVTCANPVGYRVYRKIGASSYTPEYCETGVPLTSGYELIQEINSIDQSYYTDNNDSKGLVAGFDYCYKITTVYADGAESISSEESCSILVPGTPPILKVNVLSDSPTNGEIELCWAVPLGADTINDGPFRYNIYRKAPNETELSLIEHIDTPDLLDTCFIDSDINTELFPYTYSVGLAYFENGNWIELPGREMATSLYLKLAAYDNTVNVEIVKRAPWMNYEYTIYRNNGLNNSLDSISTVPEAFYKDINLINEVEYTYRTIAKGKRPLFGTEYFFENTSHIHKATPIDTTPPCPPILNVSSICDSSYNKLTWVSSASLCETDLTKFLIYYRPTLDGEFELIGENKPEDTVFVHYPETSLAAVYGVAAVDSNNNVSEIATLTIDSCIMYKLPNVFSPNSDGVNEIFIADNPGGFVQKVDMKIYSRSGQLVFKTDNPFIEWNGKLLNSNNLVATGVYYYVCDVYEPRIMGELHRPLYGFIHVFSDLAETRSNE